MSSLALLFAADLGHQGIVQEEYVVIGLLRSRHHRLGDAPVDRQRPLLDETPAVMMPTQAC